MRTSIGAINTDLAKGQLDGVRQTYTINSNDQLFSAEQYRNEVIAYKNGAPVRLSDVANSVDGVENAGQAAWMNTDTGSRHEHPAAAGREHDQGRGQHQGAAAAAASGAAGLGQGASADRPDGDDPGFVHDVQFSMMLTIALVVMVIFLFLRTVEATVIPSIAVPLSIVGTFGVMYLLGYSLDNLSLMALTISTGFVVDDAIVMIENIDRYIEQGLPPLEAALRGAGQIGFTILSLTVSLIAVLIPLLFMGDIVGRLFREFAVTLSVAILMSAFISLTLTPMMCSRLLKQKKNDTHGRIYQWTEDAFNKTIEFYGRTLRWVLRHQTATLVVTVATLLLTFVLAYTVPKGFFPVQDTGVILGISEAAQSVSFEAMSGLQQQLAKNILQDPDVESLSSFIGIDGTNSTANSRAHPDQPEAARAAQGKRAGDHRAAAEAAGGGIRHHACTCSRCRT